MIKGKYGTLMQQRSFKTTNSKAMSLILRGIVENNKEDRIAKWMGPKAFK